MRIEKNLNPNKGFQQQPSFDLNEAGPRLSRDEAIALYKIGPEKQDELYRGKNGEWYFKEKKSGRIESVKEWNKQMENVFEKDKEYWKN